MHVADYSVGRKKFISCWSNVIIIHILIQQVNNNLIYLSHLDAVGLSLHSLKRATIEMNLIETNPESPRAFMLGEGIVLSENVLTCLANTEVVGMRIGLKISNQYEEMNQVSPFSTLSQPIQWTLFIVAASGPVLSGHYNRFALDFTSGFECN